MSRFRALARPGLILSAALLLGACGGGGSDPTEREILLDLQPVGPEGTTGTVTLSKSGSGTSVLVDALVLSGVGGQTAGVHEGTCADYAPEVAYDIGPVEEGVGGTTLDIATQALLDGNYVIVLHKSAEDVSALACAPIEAGE
jgi:hypothetical protein